MHNKEMIDKAIQFLQKVDPEELETVIINSTHYDDNSKSLEIEISWPEKSD